MSKTSSAATEADDRAIVAQLGRPMRAVSTVAKRCHLHLPVVITVPPVLDSGEPFPTRYWLTCPLAHRRIARLEGAGAVRDFDRRTETDSVFAAALKRAHIAYAEERDAGVPADVIHVPRGGVGGSSGSGIKCLHAHYAHHAAGNENPVGVEVASRIGHLDCTSACVRDGARAADWREQKNTDNQAVNSQGSEP